MRRRLQPVALSVAFAIGAFVSAQSPLRADDLAYVITFTQAFGIVDLNTGVFTQEGVSSAYLSGLGEVNNVLYGASGVTDTLYRVNPANGSLTAVGNTSINVSLLGSTTTGLFALGPGDTDLYSINPATGVATLIGPTGIASGETNGLSAGANQLYYMVSNPGSSSLYSLNTTTGAATLIGSSSPGVCLKWMAYEDSTLYDASGYCNSGSEIFKVNPANGSSQFVADVTGFDEPNGLAPILTNVSVPEPGSALLLFGGLVAVVFLRLRLAFGRRPSCR